MQSIVKILCILQIVLFVCAPALAEPSQNEICAYNFVRLIQKEPTPKNVEAVFSKYMDVDAFGAKVFQKKQWSKMKKNGEAPRMLQRAYQKVASLFNQQPLRGAHLSILNTSTESAPVIGAQILFLFGYLELESVKICRYSDMEYWHSLSSQKKQLSAVLKGKVNN